MEELKKIIAVIESFGFDEFISIKVEASGKTFRVRVIGRKEEAFCDFSKEIR